MPNNEFPFEDEFVSKTKIKEKMNNLQDLGLRLTTLSKDALFKIPLSAELLDAIADYKKIKSNSALKRQVQYIGKLMRSTNEEEINQIKNYFSTIDGTNKTHIASIKRIEQLREKLLKDESVLTRLIQDHPSIDITQLRTLIRQAKKEKEKNAPPKSYRAIFQLLKSTLHYDFLPHSE